LCKFAHGFIKYLNKSDNEIYIEKGTFANTTAIENIIHVPLF